MEELQNLTPLYNKEFYLAYLCGEDVELPIPDGNTEHYLAYLCGMDVPIPDPLYTKEFYLAYKCGMDVELPEPGPYRIDQYLAKWCGMDVEVPEPMYRIEYWLAQLANSGELKTVSGNPISVSDALARPAESLVIEILPQQDLHGYDNPWPAGGGENIIPYPYLDGSEKTTPQGITFTATDNGKVHIQGTASSSVYYNLYGSGSTPIPDWIKPNTTYYLNPATSSGKYFVQFILYGSPNFAQTGGKSFTTPADLSEYTAFALVIGIYNGAVVNDDVYPILKVGSTAPTAWSPYSNICPISGFTGVNIYHESAYDPDADPTYSISWQTEAGTVYGGELDVTTGVLTVTYVSYTVVGTENLGNNGIQGYGGIQCVYAPNPGKANGTPNTWSDLLCDRFNPAQTSNAGSVTGRSNNGNLYFNMPAEVNTIPLAKAWFSENNTQVVYKLAEPQTIQLTPTEIQMLLGNNVIWNDVGDMTLEYLADGPAEDIDALQILLGNRYVNNGEPDEASDREALDILLGGNTR